MDERKYNAMANYFYKLNDYFLICAGRKVKFDRSQASVLPDDIFRKVGSGLRIAYEEGNLYDAMFNYHFDHSPKGIQPDFFRPIISKAWDELQELNSKSGDNLKEFAEKWQRNFWNERNNI